MPPPRDQLVAITLQQTNAAERDAQLHRQDLGKGGGVALAVIKRARNDRHIAVFFKADAAHLTSGRACQFEIVADAAAAQTAPFAAFLLPRGKTVPVGKRQCLVEQRGEVTAVVRMAVRALVRHRLDRDVVAPA